LSDGNVVLAAIKKRWRGWLRAIHRDVGYLVVGLTFIYALSGLAINHFRDWDPNFVTYEKVSNIEPIDVALSDEEAVDVALARLHITTRPRSTYRAGDELHLQYDNRKIVIIEDQVTDQGAKPRFFLRVANWLHYNRGKRAWTYVADAYAILLLYLACSGLFMLKGRLGLRWRGLIFVSLGVAVPIGYVVWSGGPEAHSGQGKKAAATSPAPEAPEDEEDDGPPERPPLPPTRVTPS
jgi:hypothetical protein